MLQNLIQLAVSAWENIDGLVKDSSNLIANALEILQSCTKPSIWCSQHQYLNQCQGTVLLVPRDALARILTTEGPAFFERTLHCHWLKGLSQRHVTVVRQGSGLNKPCIEYTIILSKFTHLHAKTIWLIFYKQHLKWIFLKENVCILFSISEGCPIGCHYQ